jgi:hypothetical protein
MTRTFDATCPECGRWIRVSLPGQDVDYVRCGCGVAISIDAFEIATSKAKLGDPIEIPGLGTLTIRLGSDAFE